MAIATFAPGDDELCGILRRRTDRADRCTEGRGAEFVLLSRAGFTQADGCFSSDQAEAMEAHDDDTLLTPSEVAAMFRVNPKTVTRWARAGKISAIRTLGGHRRFRASEIRHFLDNVEESDRI
jgi:excisionase family DNA binding protein